MRPEVRLQISDVIKDCSRASDEGRESFGAIVMRLMEAGVERYHADLLRSEKTYYLPCGASEVVPNASIPVAPADTFSAAKMQAAVKAVQAGEIVYKTFCTWALEAGCVGYIVSLAGRRVVYYGRTADMHVEHFPAAS